MLKNPATMNVMNMLIPNEVGVWIQCCKQNCKKWRYSCDFDDPLAVPKKWYCHMNSDRSANNCSAPERLELDEDVIFVESKFKAGSIVWAKLIGHPWSPAMVDFCPEYETYYWFDKVNTNVPSQYHVTFFNGGALTRAWIKSAWIKSFVGNDPAFALKSKVRGKTLTAKQRTAILKGCEIARSTLHLTIVQRLKKFNFNSWRLARRFQNQSTNYAAQPTVPAAGHEEDSQTDTAPSLITETTIIDDQRKDDTEGLEDTRSIMSDDSIDFGEKQSNKRRFMAGEKQVVELQSMTREVKRCDITGHKSISENLRRTENRENPTGGSRYLRALSEFTLKEPIPLLNTTNYQKRRKIVTRKPLPDWFSNQENRRIGEIKRSSRLSELLKEEDNRMYKERRNSFIAEYASAGPSSEEKKPDSKPPSYFMGGQNYQNLLTSDEESF